MYWDATLLRFPRLSNKSVRSGPCDDSEPKSCPRSRSVECNADPLGPNATAAAVQQVGQRTVLVGAAWAEGESELIETVDDLVDRDRHGGARLGDQSVVGHRRAARVRRVELDEAVVDDIRRHDERLSIRGDLRRRGDHHLYGDVCRSGRHARHTADAHPEDLDLVAHKEPWRRGKPRRDRYGRLATAREREGDPGHDQDGDDTRDHQPNAQRDAPHGWQPTWGLALGKAFRAEHCSKTLSGMRSVGTAASTNGPDPVELAVYLASAASRGIARPTLSAFWASTADTDLRLSNNVVSCGLLVERNWLSFWLSAAVPSSRDLITARRCSSTWRTMSACPTRSKS